MYQDPSQYPYQPQPGETPYQPLPQPATPPYQYPNQPQPTFYSPQPGAVPYSPQYPYQPQPGVTPYPQQYPYQPQPGAAPYPQQYPPQYPYPYQPQQLSAGKLNPRASRAMINGIISIILAFLTLVALVGYAGLITGTFAIVYGFIGLNAAKRLPGNAGRVQAIAGIALGFAAWFLVIVSFIIRSAR